MREALVVGASMAGMLTARVLAEKFASVTLLESDTLPSDAVHRPGLPQSRQLHALLPRGLDILEQLFPGVKDELLLAGAESLDPAKDIAWLTPKGWGVRCESGRKGLAFTRDLLDYILRKRLKEWANIKIWDGARAAGLIGNRFRVEGVTLRGTNGETSIIRGDLLAVATGRDTAVPKWLEHLGLPATPQTVINARIGYASRLLSRENSRANDWKAIFIQTAPPLETRGGLLFPVEGNRWLLTLQGGDGDYPPTDEAGFLKFAESLRDKRLFAAIQNAQPLTPIAGYRRTENRLQHYDELAYWPERLLVTGDAVCAFNPVYGQGMTVAALAALSLRDSLNSCKGNLDGLARRAQKRFARINKVPWMLSTGEDLRFRGVVGAQPSFKTKAVHRYIDKVLELGTEDASLRKRFLEVQGMLRNPSDLLQPAVLMRVARRAAFGWYQRHFLVNDCLKQAKDSPRLRSSVQ
jgi:2-polyprenyl-6-methoxyphenol hydroxylase-like FAD-dependent oxidoreductase